MKKEVFESENILKSILSMVVPSILSSLIIIIYNITDIFFIGQTNDEFKVAGIAVSIPIALLVLAIGNIFGIGGASLISRLLGKKNYKSCKTASSFCCYTGLSLALLYNIIVVLFIDKFVYFIGASENSVAHAKDYLFSISFGAYFAVFSIIYSNLIRAEGCAKISTKGIFLGNVINILLDPIFILYFNLGTLGAGIATVIGNAFTCIYYSHYIIKSSSSCLSINYKDFDIRKVLVFEILSIGFPASISGLLLTTCDVVLNNTLKTYGDNVIAGMGIARRLFSMSPIILIGFASGVLPLIGYNFAAFKIDKMKKIIYKARRMSFGIGLFILLLFFFFAPKISHVFIDNDDVVSNATNFLRIICFSAIFMSINFIYIVTFQGTGKALPPLILTLCRQLLIFIPVVLIGNYLFGLYGAIFALPISDAVSCTIAHFIFRYYRKTNFR